jgi:ferrous iron transport protein B
MMELPPYRLPSLRSLAQGLYERATIFIKRVGGIILALTVLLWFLSTFPAPPEGATGIGHPTAWRASWAVPGTP